MLGMTTTNDPGTTGVKDIAEALGGGIKENCLFLIEGETDTGKSVLCQHVVYGVLHSKGSAIAFYSTDYNNETLNTQMESMSLDVTHDIATDRLRVYYMGANNITTNAEKSLKLITDHIRTLPARFQLVVIDSPSPLILMIDPGLKIDFLQECKELCEQNNRAIIIAINTHAFETKTLLRAYDMSDYYLKLKSQDTILATGQVDTRVIKVMNVTKLGGAERLGQESLKFEIKPRVGIHILPLVQIRV